MRDVLDAGDRGESQAQTARRLGISVASVKTARGGLLARLGARSILEAVAIARRDGLL